ncbi:MAG: RDD family protein [Candidatus Hodarchaeales archaeon]|jgi:uncharacterized RDD family membrane protein YckC
MGKICANCGSENDFDSRFCSNCGNVFPEEEPIFKPVKAEIMSEEKISDPQTETDYHFKVADGGKRFWAYIIDSAIVSALLSVLIGFAGVVAYGDSDIFSSVGGYYFETFPFSIGSHGIILFLYFIVTEYYSGATIGKSILGIKIIHESGRATDFFSVIINSFGKSFGIFFDVIAGWIFVSYGPNEVKLEQRLFQKFAKIVVIEAPKPESTSKVVFTKN